MALKKSTACAVFRSTFQSSFDMFMTTLYVCSPEALKKEQPALKDIVLDGKDGVTVGAPGMGAVVWLREFSWNNSDLTTLFHELVHASFHRFEVNGLEASDEAIACSTSEMGGYFLMELGEAFPRPVARRRRV